MATAQPSRPRRGATRDIRYEVPLKAAPERVYAALTSARELTRWWLSGAETDARNAGRLRLVWPRSGAAAGFGEREGFFVDLEPGRKVAWMWKPARGEKGVPPLSSFFINPRLKNCEVSLLHAGFAASADGLYDRYARGWEDCVAKLKLYIETGKTCKDEVIDLETARILSRRKR
ncbi:MAG: SRPBCC domain-containing protein [Elusimicrobiota bacterium]|nr:SRPBCC domain-containing protein [Elusimicrobiota bacterium]